ncbi:MAG: hypothetical protein JST85_00130 [Acidobacteria bacterium]|nr:hypothetical protein [Acidobacteriota bacterium]
MTLKQRLLAVGAAAAILFSGMAFGRITGTPQSTSANEEVKTSLTESPKASNETEAFYLKDFKTGYDDGYAAGQTGQISNIAATDREGYNEGFKKGYADAYQNTNQPASTAYRGSQQTVVYKPASYPAAKRRSNSKLKTVLTIAAPAAIGAGIGAAAGGKKGAGVGALIGGGGGALYHLIKNKDR